MVSPVTILKFRDNLSDVKCKQRRKQCFALRSTTARRGKINNTQTEEQFKAKGRKDTEDIGITHMQNSSIKNDILKGQGAYFFFLQKQITFVLTALSFTWLAAHQFDTQLISVYKSK